MPYKVTQTWHKEINQCWCVNYFTRLN